MRMLGRYSYICLLEEGGRKKSVTIALLSRISFIHHFPAGRAVPLHEADGEADRRESPVSLKR